MDMKTLALHAVSNSTKFLGEHAAACIGSLFMAIYTRVEVVAVVGSIVAATAIMGMLGLFLTDAVPFLRVSAIVGKRRLIANWCCGLLAYWTAPIVKVKLMPAHDLELVAGLTAAAQSLLGVSVLIIILRILGRRAGELEKRYGPRHDRKP